MPTHLISSTTSDPTPATPPLRRPWPSAAPHPPSPPSAPLGIGIGWESAATYDYNFWEAQTYVQVWAHTQTSRNGPEQQPQTSDCDLALNKLKGACGPDIRKWECQPKWGDCGKCGWGSCIQAKFQAPAVCATSLNFGVGLDLVSPTLGLSFGVWVTPLGDVTTGIFGKHTCKL